MRVLAVLWLVVFLVLHQDWWLWKDRTLVLGLLPSGLAYHACYAVGAALTMALLVRAFWPVLTTAADRLPPDGQQPADRP